MKEVEIFNLDLEKFPEDSKNTDTHIHRLGCTWEVDVEVGVDLDMVEMQMDTFLCVCGEGQ